MRIKFAKAGILATIASFLAPGAYAQGLSEMGAVYGLPRPVPGQQVTGGIQSLYNVPIFPGMGAAGAGGRAGALPVAGDNRKIANDYARRANQAFDMGKQKEKAGKLDEALSFYKKSAQLRETIWGVRDPSLLVIYKLIGDIYFKQKRFADAETAYRRLHQVGVKVYGVGAYELCPVLEKIAECLTLARKPVDAVNFYRQVYGLKKRKLGDSNPEVIRATAKLADAFARSGDIKQAQTCLEEQIGISEKTGDQASAEALKKVLIELSQRQAPGKASVVESKPEEAPTPGSETGPLPAANPYPKTPTVMDPQDLSPSPEK